MYDAYIKDARRVEEHGPSIVYSLCPKSYGEGAVWEWAARSGPATCGVRKKNGRHLDKYAKDGGVGFSQAGGWRASLGPGHWNESDMLEVGKWRHDGG